MKEGIYYDIPFDEYLKIDAFSKSMVDPILKSPLHLKHKIEEGFKASNIMVFGSLVDTILTEPERLEKNFFILPETYTDAKGNQKPWHPNSNTCKKILQEAAESGKACVKQPDIERASAISLAVHKHKTASEWVKGKKQVTIIWTDPETQVKCKGRIDLYLEGERLIDMKVTDDPHPVAFSRTATYLKYHVQAAMYLMGLYCAEVGKYAEDWNMPFSFIAAEANKPHDVMAYNMTQESLDAGKFVFQEAVRLYADCKETGTWNGRSQFAEDLSIQQWAIHKILYDGENEI